MIKVELPIPVYAVMEKFELYEWLGDQNWQADKDYLMSMRSTMDGQRIDLWFENPQYAMLTKLTWGGA